MAVFSVKFKLIILSAVLAGLLALPHPASASAVTSANIISLSNSQRSAAGLGALGYNALLERAAYNKAADMLANGYWAHTSPSGLTPWSIISGVGYSYQSAGENLAKGYSTSEGVVTGWMNSPGHRANVLGGYTQTGVAVVAGTLNGQATTLVVAFYATPVALVPPAPAPKPAPVAAAAPAPAPAPAPKPAPVALVPPAPAPKPVSTAPAKSNESEATVAPATEKAVTTPVDPKIVTSVQSDLTQGNATIVQAAKQTKSANDLWYGVLAAILLVPMLYSIRTRHDQFRPK